MKLSLTIKEEQRQAVEKKLEQKGQAEAEQIRHRKRRLFLERRRQHARLCKLADHAERVKEVCILFG